MKILLNGESKEVTSLNFDELLSELSSTGVELKGKRFAIEQNGEIVPRTNYLSTPIKEGDQIEIVHFVGGG
jgi:sulfur carrier protein